MSLGKGDCLCVGLYLRFVVRYMHQREVDLWFFFSDGWEFGGYVRG
jgi:hypothetical protein